MNDTIKDVSERLGIIGIDDPLLAGAQLRPRNKTPAKA